MGHPVTAMDQRHALFLTSVIDLLLRGIENKSGIGCGADLPTDNPSDIGVNDESNLDGAPLGCAVNEGVVLQYDRNWRFTVSIR